MLARQGHARRKRYGDALSEVGNQTHLSRHVQTPHRLDTDVSAAPLQKSLIHHRYRKQGHAVDVLDYPQEGLEPAVCYRLLRFD